MSIALPHDRIRKLSLGRRFVERPEVGAAIGLVILWALFAILGPDSGFLSSRGVSSYLNIAAQVGIVGTTVTLLLIAGDFDLSIGSMVGFSGMIIALGTTKAGWPLWAAMLAAFAFALAYGWGVGMLVVRGGIPSFIVTLAGLFLLRGAAIGFCARSPSSPISAASRTRSATIRSSSPSPASWSRALTSASCGGSASSSSAASC